MPNLASQLLLLLTATVAVFFIATVIRGNKARKADHGSKSRLQIFEHSVKPVKTALIQAENEVAARFHNITGLQTRFEELQTRAIKKEQTEIARLLNKITESDCSATSLDCESTEDDTELTQLGNELNREEAKIRQTEVSLTKAQGIKATIDQRLAELKTHFDINQTTAERTRTESASLQREINNLQARLNTATDQDTKATSRDNTPEQPGTGKKSELEQSIGALQENLNKKIANTKTNNYQRDLLVADLTVLEEQANTLDTEVQSLRKELQGSKHAHQYTIFALRKAVTEKETQFSDGGATDRQLVNLQRSHKKLQHEYIGSLKKADQRITDLTRELNRSEIKIQSAADKATGTTSSGNADLQQQITSSNSESKFEDKYETDQADTENQLEKAELKAKLKELHKLLTETIVEKKALQERLEHTIDSKQSSTTISDSIGITDSTTNKKSAKRKLQKPVSD